MTNFILVITSIAYSDADLLNATRCVSTKWKIDVHVFCVLTYLMAYQVSLYI